MIQVHSLLLQEKYVQAQLFESYLDQQPPLAPPETRSAAILLEEPGWIHYEFDFKRNKAVFFDIGQADVINTPFAFVSQQRVVKRVALVDFADVLVLAEKLPRRHRLIQFYNIGHCGSTLLHNVFNESGEAWDISEPKLSWDIAMARNTVPRPQLVALARAGLAFLSRLPLANQRETLIVKHVSQCTQAYDLWREAWPQATNIYMYRDAISWCNSLYGFVQRVGLPIPMTSQVRHFGWMMTSGGEPESFLAGLIDLDSDKLQFWEMAACGWALHAQQFSAAKHAGLQALALRYNELMADREGVLHQVFAHCGLDPDKVAASLKAFDHDAHEGEATAHDKPVENLSAAAKARITELLRRPKLNVDADTLL